MSFHYYSPTLLFIQEAGNCAFEWFGLVCGALCMVRSGSRNFGQGGPELAILAKGVGEGRGENCQLCSKVSQLPKCIHNSIDAQRNRACTVSFRTLPLPLYLVFIRKDTRKLIKYKILLNPSEHFYWLNASTWFTVIDVRSRPAKSARKLGSYVLIME